MENILGHTKCVVFITLITRTYWWCLDLDLMENRFPGCPPEHSLFSGNRLRQWSRFELPEPVRETGRKCTYAPSAIYQCSWFRFHSGIGFLFMLNKLAVCVFVFHPSVLSCLRTWRSLLKSSGPSWTKLSRNVRMLPSSWWTCIWWITCSALSLLDRVFWFFLLLKEPTSRRTASPWTHVALWSTSWMYPRVKTLSTMLAPEVVRILMS